MNYNVLSRKEIINIFEDAYRKYFKEEAPRDISITGYISINKTRISYKSAIDIAALMQARMDKGLFKVDPLSIEELQHLGVLLETNVITIGTAAFMVGYSDSAFRVYLAQTGSVENAVKELDKKKTSGSAPIILTWKGVSMNVHGWADALNVNYNTILKRLDRHGLHELVFMTIQEYKSVPKKERDKVMGPRAHKCNQKRTIDQDELDGMGEKSRKNRVRTEISQKQAADLLGRIIEDSKENIIQRNKLYYESSKRFLLNVNGMLEEFLNGIAGINTESALIELRNFVNANTGDSSMV